MVIFHPKNKRLHRFFFKYVALTTLIYLILSVPSHANPILLVLGDSLSAAYQIPPEDGWVSLLEDRLKKTYPDAVVINSSIVGDTTANGLERLPGLLEKHHPTIVIIELGGNDGLRGLSVKAIQDNLNKMISLSLGSKARVLLVGMQLPPNYGGNYRKQFNDVFTSLSANHKIAFVPFLLDNIALHPKLMFEDRIHPTKEAQPLIVENVWPYLSPLLGEVN